MHLCHGPSCGRKRQGEGLGKAASSGRIHNAINDKRKLECVAALISKQIDISQTFLALSLRPTIMLAEKIADNLCGNEALPPAEESACFIRSQ